MRIATLVTPAPGLCLLAGLSLSVHAADLLFFGIPPAENVEQAKAAFDKRARIFLQAARWEPLGRYDFQNGGAFPTKAMGRLALGQDVEDFNRVILDPATVVYSAPGTDFQDLDFLCRRTGDYDFMLKSLVPLTYHLQNNLWLCGVHDESENHILMTEGSRFLTNQLMERAFRAVGRYEPTYDNQANRMVGWLLGHLQQFLKNDFTEYNSHPYQAYSVIAIQNL